MAKIHRIVLFAVVLIVGLFYLPSCFFDPDPGPDAHGSEADMDADAGMDTDGGCPPLVYDSAPDIDDTVTVIGLADAVDESIIQIHAWSDAPGEPLLAPVSEDNSFAFRINARDGDIVFLDMDAVAVARQLPVMSELLDVLDTFEDAHISPQDHETIIVSGTSSLLKEGHWVFGGNVTQSIAAATPVECQEVDCGFEFSIPGESGDEIDLFLVHENNCSGLTAAHTLTVE